MRFAIAAAAVTGLLTGCGMMESMTGRASTAEATLQPNKDSGVKGAATFAQKGDKVQLVANISGLKPNQEHGFHVHEKGDCSSGDGMSAGGHLNPAGKRHGPPVGEHHAGDLPSIKADANGVATVRTRVAGTVLGAGAEDIAGKAIVVH